MEDREIIRLFLLRSENAISELSQKYGGLCMKLAFNILGDREDAEECVNDAYLAIWDTISCYNPDHLVSFVIKVVRNISINRYHYNTRKKRNSIYTECLDELRELPGRGLTDETFEAKEAVTAINDYLRTLDKQARLIFIGRHWYAESYKSLSEKTGMKEGAIRTRLHRLRADLYRYLEKRGVIVC